MKDVFLSESWSFTVLRLTGLRLLRPEKSWRPIVTVVVDGHEAHETILGSDGQNTNMKAPFIFRDAGPNSRVEVTICQRSQSKRKGKKRNLVASASLSLGELVKRQGSETKIEIRLTCQPPQKNCTSSRGKPQNGASLIVRIRRPSALRPSSPTSSESAEDDMSDVLSSGQALSDTLTMSAPPSPLSEGFDETIRDDDQAEDIAGEKPKKPRIRGYCLDSEEDDWSDGDDFDLPEDDHEEVEHMDEDAWQEDMECPDVEPLPGVVQFPPESLVTWMAASLNILPHNRSDLDAMSMRSRPGSVMSTMSISESALDSFTIYREILEVDLTIQDLDVQLQRARDDPASNEQRRIDELVAEIQYSRTKLQKIVLRLQSEWQYVGGLLVALAAVHATVFGIAPDGSTFHFDNWSRRSTAVGSVGSGLGLCIDAYFWLRYSGEDIDKFRIVAKDVFGTYFFFCLSARVPALCSAVSIIALMVFLLSVAYSAWPAAVLVMCFLAGILVTLQFIAYGAYRFYCGVVSAGKMTKRGIVRVTAKLTRTATPAQDPSSSTNSGNC